MSGSVVVLEPTPAAGLKACEPNLMPFHISYTGPALISTFMDIKPAKDDEPGMPAPQEPADGATEGPSTESRGGVVGGSTVGEKKEATGTGTEASMAADTTPVVEEPLETPSTNKSTRTVSTFRGRIIQGLKVDLPKGYGGLVLQAPPAHATTSASSSKPSPAEPSKAASSSKSRPTVAQEGVVDDDDEYPTARSTRRRGRLARSAVSTKVIDVEKEEEAEKKKKAKAKEAETIDVDEEAATMDVDATGQDTSSAQRRLKPVAQFSSFTIWHPDNPIVEMQDEYYRSVHEWTALATAVRVFLVSAKGPVLNLGCTIG